MGNLLSSLGFGGEDNTIWILVLVIILFCCNGNSGGIFSGNNSCNPGDNDNDWTWILIVVVILLLCNGNNGLLGGVGDNNRKPC